MLLSSVALAGHYDNKELFDCRVNRMVDYTFFEEALTPYEYPDVDIRISPQAQYSVGIGGNNPYELAEGDKVTLKTEKHKGTVVKIVTQYKQEIQIEIEYRRSMAKMVIRARQSNEGRLKAIAYGMCNKGFLE